MMNLVDLAEATSTSSIAAGLLNGGERMPFAVLAQSQTQGRGTRGRAWQSPEGNVYLTLAMPVPPPVSADWGLLPLKAAALIARLIERKAGVRPTLKWPNDLMFAGRKVGGLLLETSVSGGVAHGVLVGIGLNVATAPDLPPPYQAIALDAIAGPTQNARAWALAIVDCFEREWAELSSTQIIDLWREYALEPGQPVIKRTEPTDYALMGIPQADGSLPIYRLNGGEELLHSADHEWQWAYFFEDQPLLVADVGNSRTKFARFLGRRGTLEVKASVANDAEDVEFVAALRRLSTHQVMNGGWPLHTVSVNDDAWRRLSELCPAAGLQPVPLPRRSIRLRMHGYAAGELGLDRLAAVEGWLVEPRGRAAVIVNAGTAMTVDVVAGDGRHLGGYIVPGLGTALKALRRAAPRLPLLAPPLPGEIQGDFGHGTSSAMLEGVTASAVGLIERALMQLADFGNARSTVDVVLTGGDAAALKAAYPAGLLVDDLVLIGIRSLVFGGSISSGSEKCRGGGL